VNDIAPRLRERAKSAATPAQAGAHWSAARETKILSGREIAASDEATEEWIPAVAGIGE
jgi:hypothetical protein